MISLTPVLKRRSDVPEDGRRQLKSKDVEADTARRSHATGQECTSAGPEQRGRKRKSFDANQERDIKRTRRAGAQSTHLIKLALESVQDEQDQPEDSKGSEASQGELLKMQC